MAATVYYPQFDAIRYDAEGYRVVVASETFDVYNVTASSSLGTAASDGEGVVPAGSVSASPGDVIEFSNGSWPLTMRMVLAATPEEAEKINAVKAYCVENLATASTVDKVDVYMHDEANLDTPPVKVGTVPAGTDLVIPFEGVVAKNLRFYPVSIDDELNKQLPEVDLTNYTTVTTTAIGGGGTTLPTAAQGDLIYGSSAGVYSALAKNTTATRYLANTGTSNNPAWAQIDLSNGVTGTLGVTAGGTGMVACSQGDIVYGSASNVYSRLAKSASTGYFLSNSGTSNNPAWANPLTVGNPVASGGANRILYENGSQNLAAHSGLTWSGTVLGVTGNVDFGSSGTGYLVGYGGSKVSFSDDGSQNAVRFTPFGNGGYWKTFISSTNLFFQFVPTTGITKFDSYNAAMSFGVSNADDFYINTFHNVGIGTTSPTARLHLRAGASGASTAPLKFTSGTLLTTAEAGAVEFLTDKFYGTITTGAARKEFIQGDSAITDGVNIVIGTTTGTKIGTATTQKIGFFNATPVVQEAGSNDVLASLVTLGLRAASSNPPLNLGTGALTCGTIAAGDHITIADGKNVSLNTTTGTKFGTSTSQKLAFWNTSPIAQPTTAVAGATHTPGGATPVDDDSLFDGYTIGQVVKALRNMGLLA